MKVVFLCRDGAVARYIAHELHADGVVDAIVVESGRIARRRKLRRAWARAPWWKSPLFVLDLLALAIYGKLWGRFVARAMRAHAGRDIFPQDVPVRRVDDANDAECLSILEGLSPNVLVVLGTSILESPILAIPRIWPQHPRRHRPRLSKRPLRRLGRAPRRCRQRRNLDSPPRRRDRQRRDRPAGARCGSSRFFRAALAERRAVRTTHPRGAEHARRGHTSPGSADESGVGFTQHPGSARCFGLRRLASETST